METLLALFTGIELIIVLAVVSYGVQVITRSLKGINQSLAKISWGVRAIESETGLLTANVPPLIDTFRDLSAGADAIAASLSSADAHLESAARLLGAKKGA